MNFSHFRVSFSIDRESFRKINYRPFIAGAIAVFILKFFTLLGFEPAKFISPIPGKIEKSDSVRPKLEQKINDFKIKKVGFIIPEAQAHGKRTQPKSVEITNRYLLAFIHPPDTNRGDGFILVIQ